MAYQPCSQGLSTLDLGGRKMKDPGNEVVKPTWGFHSLTLMISWLREKPLRISTLYKELYGERNTVDLVER